MNSMNVYEFLLQTRSSKDNETLNDRNVFVTVADVGNNNECFVIMFHSHNDFYKCFGENAGEHMSIGDTIAFQDPTPERNIYLKTELNTFSPSNACSCFKIPNQPLKEALHCNLLNESKIVATDVRVRNLKIQNATLIECSGCVGHFL